MTQPDAVTEPKLFNRPDGPDQAGAREINPAELTRLFEKLPPHAIEAEMCVLGSMFLDPAVVGDVLQILQSGDDFYRPANGTLFEMIKEQYDKHNSFDVVTLHQAVVDRGLLQAVGGQEYLVGLVEQVPTAAHAEYYARLVQEKAIVRRLITVAGEIIHEAHHSPDKPKETLEKAEQRIFRIAEGYERFQYTSIAEWMAAKLENLDDDGAIKGIPTGFDAFDDLTGGLQQGELLILAARPSMGKTAFGLNIAEEIATAGHPVGFFSLEMGVNQLALRLIASRSGVDVQKLQRNMLSQEERRDGVKHACLELQQIPMYVDDNASLTLMQLRAKARRMKTKHDIKVIIVDYLQLVTVGYRTESRQVEVSEISRGLKALARELEVPVLCLAQLNRGPEQREGHKPRLSDLRESGSIEQDADVVMLLHREAYYHKEDKTWEEENPDRANVTDLIIAKQRNGPTGVVNLLWDAKTTRFRNMIWSRGEGYG